MIIFLNGWAEVFTEFEGNEFQLERLGPKSVLNQNNILVQDYMYCNVRCMTACFILELTEDQVWKIA